MVKHYTLSALYKQHSYFFTYFTYHLRQAVHFQLQTCQNKTGSKKYPAKCSVTKLKVQCRHLKIITLKAWELRPFFPEVRSISGPSKSHLNRLQTWDTETKCKIHPYADVYVKSGLP